MTGAGGSQGLVTLTKSPPDGDTLGVGATGALADQSAYRRLERARSAARADAGRQADRGRHRRGGQPEDRPEEHQGDARARQGEPAGAELRLDRGQHRPAPLHGDAQGRDRRQSGAHPLSRQRAGDRRSGRRPDPGRLGRHHLGLSAYRRRPGDRARHGRDEALPRRAGNPDDRRMRRARLRPRRRLHRAVRAGRDAGGRGEADLGRGPSNPRLARDRGQPEGADRLGGLRGRAAFAQFLAAETARWKQTLQSLKLAK